MHLSASLVAQWPPAPPSVGRARHRLREALAGRGLGALTDPAVLVLSELMTNALRHGGEEQPDRLGTRFVREAGGVRIEVTDSVTALPRMCAAGPEDVGGRGVALVETLTGGQWGVSSSVCGVRRWLPGQLVPAAQALARPGEEPPPVDRDLRCVLQAHTAGEHHAYVMHLDGRDTGSVWVRWEEQDGPLGLAVLADCGAPAPAPLDEACCQYADHPGGHRYDLTDPWQP